MTTRHSGYCAIVGRPNVGKSTLLNRLIGQKLAITSRKPQTTRHTILGVKNAPAGQVVYVDTPGIHQRGDQAMNRYLNRTAKSALAGVDLLLFVVEALVWNQEDEAVLAAIAESAVPAILVVNKVDRVHPKEKLLPYLAETAPRHEFQEVFPVSATGGDNCEALEQGVVGRLPVGEPIFPEDQLTDRSERFFASELIREQLIRRYAKEIPYALTVEIEQFREEGELYRIAAIVWVERPGQKNIIVGSRGQALKEVATEARLAMERMFGRKVFLQVWVKVRKSWSSDEAALQQLGYSD
ncbi:MAG TPA: GTPase Era [Sedimenticola sp.]|nr:GTPase Era [Sedimenticola sp.]